MPEHSQVEFEDLQGIVRFAHGKLKDTAFLLLKIKDADAARRWLADAPVTTAVKQPKGSRPDTALQIAFTAEGLRILGVPEDVVAGFSEEFLTGMTASDRSRRLGDTGANAPDKWEWGGQPDDPPHLLLMLYACPGGLEKWRAEVSNATFDEAFDHTLLPTNDRVEDEPFGFRDGLSQPAIDWHQAQSTDVHRRDSYSNLLALGEVVLGYLNEYGYYTDRPLLSADAPGAGILPDAPDEPGKKDLGRNGSYLVLRQLHQDVPGFWQFVDRAAGGDADKRADLARGMVGRERDGTPLMPAIKGDVAGIDPDDLKVNEFNFDADPDGLVCPIGAHIRRANPRTGDFPPGVAGPVTRMIRTLGFGRDAPDEDLVASTRFHRILRRGRQYGETITPEQALDARNDNKPRGLQFVCLGANISRQFEFVQNAWIASGKFDGLQNESDPLLGNREPLADGTPTDSFSRPRFSGPRECVTGLPQFVTVRGGAYFFLPGMRALKYIAGVRTEQQ